MSGNMTKEGLTKDLEAIEKVGIGGILLFNVSQGIPNGPIKYNSPEHHEMLKHAAFECERLGLSFGVHNCDGWSSSGGPWITPEQSMKMVVWSETIVKGGTIKTELPQPTTREGFYKDIAVGTGVGTRLDFSFFIFRIDWGLKLIDPALKNKWVLNKGKIHYEDWMLNVGIGYPF